MQPRLLPLDQLGAIERNGQVRFGIWLPWVSAQDGNRVSVKLIHESDQFLRNIPPHQFALSHEWREPHGDYWSATVPLAGAQPQHPGSAWGQPGRYVYRYQIVSPQAGMLDWIVDPFAREFGVGKLSAFTLGYQPHTWSAEEDGWRTPPLHDLVIYELNIAELRGDLQRAAAQLAYLRDLGVNAVEIMPLSNVAESVDWGYLPIGYFGVDERFGRRADLQAFIDLAHRHGIAVLVDVVYGHTGVDFAYHDAYTRLQYRDNPFMGPFAKDYFSNFGKSTDFNRALTRDYFFTVNHHWLEVYHVDGFRYDCVPNFWDGALGAGYANLVYETHRLAAGRVAAGDRYWRRFAGDAQQPLRMVQCAEQLEAPQEILAVSYSNCTWQNTSFDAARDAARGDRGRLRDLGLSLSLFGYVEQTTTNGDPVPKTALQYIENHDHERFVCNFGLSNRDEAGNPLFAQGDRAKWFKVQPYLIALLLAKGIPMLWQGQEFCENYFLPDIGSGRVGLLRPLRWDYFYDQPGRDTLALVRRLTSLRRREEQLRRGACFFFDDWHRYQSRGLLLFARHLGEQYTLVAVNTSDEDQAAPFWFPGAGDYREELHGGGLDLRGVEALREVTLTIPSNYGRVWTRRLPGG